MCERDRESVLETGRVYERDRKSVLEAGRVC